MSLTLCSHKMRRLLFLKTNQIFKFCHKFESSAFAFDFNPSEAWNFQPFWSLKFSTFVKLEISSFRRVEISRFRRVEISKQTNAKVDDSNFYAFLLTSFLKVSKTQKQIVKPWILPKNKIIRLYYYDTSGLLTCFR